MERLTIDELFESYGILDVNGDDVETGKFRLFETEGMRAEEYRRQGYTIASVFEDENGDEYVVLDNSITNDPEKTGYYIIK